MSLALFGAYRLIHPLQHVARSFIPAQALQATRRKPVPLRVARVMDESQAQQSAGRMVISGRMADVCAELDRLVERENQS
ncbi:MAG: hypothetical protein RLZZ24_327 [Pseudomonadota bacterium]|jgi:hypothetical protein